MLFLSSVIRRIWIFMIPPKWGGGVTKHEQIVCFRASLEQQINSMCDLIVLQSTLKLNVK